MTNTEFLADIERRGINGDKFTHEEINHLRKLAGTKPTMFAPETNTWMRGGARRLAKQARKNLAQQVARRFIGEQHVTIDIETTYKY